MKRNKKDLAVRLIAALLCLMFVLSAIAVAIVYVAAEEAPSEDQSSTSEAPSDEGSSSESTSDESSSDESSSDESSSDESSSDESSSDESSSDESSSDESSSDESSSDESSSDESSSDESSSDESSSDESSSDESSSDESSSDESSSDETTSEETTTEPPEVPDEEVYIFDAEDYLVRCAIFFMEETKESYFIRTSNVAKDKVSQGYRLFTTTEDGAFHHIWELYEPSVTVNAFANYRIELPFSFISQSRTIEYMERYKEAAENAGVTLFPAYVNGTFRIRCGAYSSRSSAETELELISELLGLECTIAEPTETSQEILNEAGEPVFDFDMGTLTYGLGLYPMQDEDETYYNKIPSGYFWPGIFEFKRYEGLGRDGITLVMIAELEDYVKSVVAWEIDPVWPAETVKAFTISARTFVVNNSHERAKHDKYGVDICCDNCCQVSRGYSKYFEEVSSYVDQTKSEVLICNGELITTYYNAVGGGCVVAGHEVWNQPAEDYLIGQFTPWEKYETHKFGAWQFSATPEELLACMRSAGYTSLKGSIESVTINKLCENSTYVYSVTVTDIYKTSVTISRNRNIRAAFEDYLYSGNFVIKHKGLIDTGANPSLTSVSGLTVMTGNGIKVVKDETELSVITGSGIKSAYLPDHLIVKTSASHVSLDVLAETVKFIEQTSYDENDTSFTFIGKGYGHGVGASQIGARDLGDLGYSYTEILYTYYPNTELVIYDEWLASKEQ